VQENLERKKTNKSKAMSTKDIPVEESTKDGSFSTLSLSPPITKTDELFFFFNIRLKSPQGQPQR
jgi:hypothetical protein